MNDKSHQHLTSFKWGQEKKKLQIKYLHLASSQPVSLHFTSLVLSKQWLHFCTGGRRNTRELQMNLKPLVGGQGTRCYALLSHNSIPTPPQELKAGNPNCFSLLAVAVPGTF